MAERKEGQSQLDFLWDNYGEYEVSSDLTSGTIPTADAVLSIIDLETSAAIVDLKYRDHPSDSTLKLLVGLNSNDEEVVVLEVPKEVYLVEASARLTTSEDEDYELHTIVLSLVMSDGTEYLVPAEDLGLIEYTSKDTTTVVTDITNGVISSEIVVAPATNAIKLSKTDSGLDAQLVLSEDSEINFTVSDGLSGSIPLLNTDYTIKFYTMKLTEYLTIEPEDGVVYFISNKPYIYLNGVRYGFLRDGLISDLSYNPSTYELSYVLVDDDTSVTLDLSQTDSTITELLEKVAYSLQIEGSTVSLLNSSGDVISSANLVLGADNLLLRFNEDGASVVLNIVTEDGVVTFSDADGNELASFSLLSVDAASLVSDKEGNILEVDDEGKLYVTLDDSVTATNWIEI